MVILEQVGLTLYKQNTTLAFIHHKQLSHSKQNTLTYAQLIGR